LRVDDVAINMRQALTEGTGLESFVTTAQIQLLSRITKTGWLDSDDAHRVIVDEIMVGPQRTTQLFVHSVSVCPPVHTRRSLLPGLATRLLIVSSQRTSLPAALSSRHGYRSKQCGNEWPDPAHGTS
jgi:hypothetical protein